VSSAILPRGVAAGVQRRLTPEPERELPTDPVAWVRDELDEHTWSGQRRVMRAVVEHRDVAVQSCHGIGKSYTAARLAAWWIAAHPIGEAKVVTTAPSGHQVRTILWGELARAHRRGGLPGSISRGQVPEWTIDGEIVGFGRKPQDYTSAEQARTQFQGIHARYLLVILDEAGGVPEWLWDATTSLVTNEGARRLAIGNPDDPTTRFERVCRPGSGWHVEQIGYADTPNFTGERVPEQLRESLIGQAYVDTAEREWGTSSPLYTSKVLGLFPDVSDDVVVTPRMIREAHARSLPGLGRGRFGMDVARFGADETCIYRNRDGVIRLADLPAPLILENGAPDELAGKPAAWRGADTDLSRQRAQALLDARPHVPMSIDVVGLGAGVYDPLRAKGYPVEPFSGGEAAHEALRFVNRRTEAWWALREGMEQGLIDLEEDDEVLAAQLQGPRWKLDTAQRRIRLETKEEMAKRGVPSPDRADAVVQAWYEGAAGIDDADSMLREVDEEGGSSITGDLLNMPT
jgi:hypothetical protein